MPVGPLSVTNISTNSCQLEWKPPANSSDIPEIHYEVYWQIEGQGDKWTICNDREKATQYVVRNLSPNTAYHFQVIANSNGEKSEPLRTTTSICTRGNEDKQ